MGLRREVRLALVVALVALPSSARADVDLVVIRHDGATSCPDGEELRRLSLASAASAASTASSSSSPTHAYRASFTRSGGLYGAEIVDDTAGRTRHLEDAGPGCAPLAQAAAVVMATMWSSEQSDASEPTPVAAANPEPVPNPSPSSVPSGGADDAFVERAAPARHARWVLGAVAGLAVGIVRPVAPALFLDGALELAHASLAVGALWIPEQRIGDEPGSVHVRLVSGSLRACAFLGEATQLGACATMFAGQLHAGGSGFSVDAEHSRPWFALEPQVFVDRSLFPWIRGRAAAGLVVPLHAESFSVKGAGAAYDTPAVGGLVTLSLEIATP